MSASTPTTTNGNHRRETTRHYGKYRGTVTDNKDPRNQGRLRLMIPEILGDIDSGWALPCVPYAGAKTGAFMVPAIGTGVWVEFEAGDVSRPVWVGCWWSSDDVPTDESGTDVPPEVRIIRSEEGLLLAFHDDEQTIALSDANGSNLLRIEVNGGTVTLKASSKVVIDAPQIEHVANATHPAVYGDDLVQFLTQLVTTFNTHMHPGQTAGPFPVTPMVPTPMASTPTPQILSTKVKVG